MYSKWSVCHGRNSCITLLKSFIDEYDRYPEGCNYNVLVLQRIEGALDPIRLQAALNALVQDHVLLNSHIHEQDGELYWRRNDAIHPLQHYTDRTLLTQVIRRPFDIYRGPLYRWALFAEESGAIPWRWSAIIW